MDEDMWLEHNLWPWLDDDSMADSYEDREADCYDLDGVPLWWDEGDNNWDIPTEDFDV